MKKIILCIVFLASIPALVFSQDVYIADVSGVYFTPYAGYCFGEGNGLMTGLSIGYRFNNNLIIEADGLYRKINGEYAYQAKTLLGIDFQLENHVSFDMGLGLSAVIFTGNTVPAFGFRLGIGGNVFKNFINLSVCYDSETLFDTKNFDGMIFAHGVILKARFLIPSDEMQRKGKQ